MRTCMLIGIAVLSVLVMSCTNALQQFEHGRAALTIGIAGAGSTRSLARDGLPDLTDGRTKVCIVVKKHDAPHTELGKKDFADSGSSLLLTLPVGETIRVSVTVAYGAAEWTGLGIHTVTDGLNRVGIKLKKGATALKPLLFTIDKPDSGAGNVGYTLLLKTDSTQIKQEHIKDHCLCRDSKGRIYVAHKNADRSGSFKRYTIEGDDDVSFTIPSGVENMCLASDLATGAVYAAADSGAHKTVYRLKNNGTLEALAFTLSRIIDIDRMAVHNNIAIIYSTRDGLKMFRIDGTAVSEIMAYGSNDGFSRDTGIHLTAPNGTGLSSKVQDLYMTADSLYVLFSQ